MSTRIYMDVHIRRAITTGLRLRGVDVLTAQEDDTTRLADPELLDRATHLGRLLFTQDDDLLREAAMRQREGRAFTGVIYAHQMKLSVGKCISDLELISKAGEPEEFANRVEFLPL